jgi:hypothetical protein
MKITANVDLEVDNLEAFKWVEKGDDGELKELSSKETVKGDSLNMLAGDIKEKVGQDFQDMAEIIISLKQRIIILESKILK